MTTPQGGGDQLPEGLPNGDPSTDPNKPPQGDPKPELKSPEPPSDDADLAAWKKWARQWERTAKGDAAKLSETNAELERLREAGRTESEKALAKARREGAAEAEQQWRGRWMKERVSGEALRALTGRVISPRLLLPHLELVTVKVSDDGTVDTAALKSAVDQLIEEFPDQAIDVTGSGSFHPAPSGDLGPRRTVPGASKSTLAAGADLYRQRHSAQT
ncbi:MAG: hypothetical protein ACT4NY_09090 [Pseudonocardiales bacterium]